MMANISNKPEIFLAIKLSASERTVTPITRFVRESENRECFIELKSTDRDNALHGLFDGWVISSLIVSSRFRSTGGMSVTLTDLRTSTVAGYRFRDSIIQSLDRRLCPYNEAVYVEFDEPYTLLAKDVYNLHHKKVGSTGRYCIVGAIVKNLEG